MSELGKSKRSGRRAVADWPKVILRRRTNGAADDIVSYSILLPGRKPPPEPAGREAETYMPVSNVERLVEATRRLVHQVDPQVTGPMANKAVSPDRRQLALAETREALKPFENQ